MDGITQEVTGIIHVQENLFLRNLRTKGLYMFGPGLQGCWHRHRLLGFDRRKNGKQANCCKQ